MSWYEISKRMTEELTDGTEFCIDDKEKEEVKKVHTKIGHTYCDYCGKDVICIWDDYNKDNWYGYLGNQAQIPRNYTYSPIINILRKTPYMNSIYNLHSRCHTKPNDWSKRAHKNALRILCTECFKKTYKRVKVKSNDGILCEISVLPERGETIESVMDDLDIKGEIL